MLQVVQLPMRTVVQSTTCPAAHLQTIVAMTLRGVRLVVSQVCFCICTFVTSVQWTCVGVCLCNWFCIIHKCNQAIA